MTVPRTAVRRTASPETLALNEPTVAPVRSGVATAEPTNVRPWPYSLSPPSARKTSTVQPEHARPVTVVGEADDSAGNGSLKLGPEVANWPLGLTPNGCRSMPKPLS